ncbi:MAG: UDP-2,4-diacetamido-2,4,6-trideoxy-beta-L-altropyranose hydrolase [Betaproteobacteria bacterium]|nr:UDP-2,4-diacetamido-2,4,6-trideoxy-beta-L-altropyranose hydrolase [Betaproteobacteria bacterium]
MKFIFRSDASLQIGTGHVVRCLTLAQALSGRGMACQFVCREHPGNLLQVIRKQGFEVVTLPMHTEEAHRAADTTKAPLAHAAWLGADWRTDAEQTKTGMGNAAVDWLVVDHYALDSRWESALRPHCRKLMVIDDLADRPHDCDLLLDQNLTADMTRRYNGKTPDHCGHMLGPEYALLQPQYAELHSRVPPREGPVRRVLIYFGGADTDNLTGKAVAAFIRLGRTDITLDVVINPASPHAASLRQQADGCAQVVLHNELPSLAPLMVQADLALGAGGATSWERCCLGLPALVITLAENQKPIAAELDRRGLLRWLGHKHEVSETTFTQALQDIFATGISPEWAERFRQQPVDGQGAERVVSTLMLNEQTRFKARLARLEDESLILQWANDPLVRRNAFASEAIDPATHRTWFRKRLRDPEHCQLYVVETEEGLPVGQTRFERSDGAWEIDYALDARARGRGLGKPLLQTAMSALRTNTGQALLLARVKDSNEASCKVFEALGFESDRQEGGQVVYRRPL